MREAREVARSWRERFGVWAIDISVTDWSVRSVKQLPSSIEMESWFLGLILADRLEVRAETVREIVATATAAVEDLPSQVQGLRDNVRRWDVLAALDALLKEEE